MYYDLRGPTNEYATCNTIYNFKDAKGLKQPTKSDHIYDLVWHPKKNLLITFNAKIERKVDFSSIMIFDVPSINKIFSTTLAGLEIVHYEFNKSGNLLAVLCKTPEKNASFSIKVYDMSTNDVAQATENLKPEKNINYFTYIMCWVNNNLVIAGKYKENNIETMNVRFFKVKTEKTILKFEAWNSDKNIANYKASHLIASPNGIHFILANMDSNIKIYKQFYRG